MDKQESFSPFVEGSLENYCKNMSKDSVWGGQLEINALAQKYKFNVIVHQVSNPNMILQFHEPMGSVPTVHLSYHRGRHYNSVRRKDDPIDHSGAPINEYVVGHDMIKNREFIKSLKLSKDEKKEIKEKL